MPPPRNMKLIGIDGELELYATEDMENGVLYNTMLDKTSPKKPLQVFFKWGRFKSPGDATSVVNIKSFVGVFRIKGGPGSGHVGHAGRPGSVGGSVPGTGTTKVSFGKWSEHTIGSARRKRIVRKVQLASGTAVMTSMPVGWDVPMLSTSEMESIVRDSIMGDVGSGVNSITFRETLFGAAGTHSPKLKQINISTHTGTTKRTKASMVSTLDHELAHHAFHKLSATKVRSIEHVASEYKGKLGTLDMWQVLHYWDTNRPLAVSEFHAKTTELYLHKRKNLRGFEDVISMVEGTL